MAKTLTCPGCGGLMYLKKGKHGKFYGCTNFPECREVHCAHQDTGEPMGIPADKETRQWRLKAHEVFDKLWRNGGWKRSEAYRWLAKVMGLDKKEAHIGMFDMAQCKKLIRKANSKKALREHGNVIRYKKRKVKNET